ncbi:MAG: sulfotransferase family protein [Rhodobacteraceae bacterium]|nr:sulfotransferase family protein [Paracoccaceae bacterium]
MLRVIGAGFGRTGTDSMREALNMLGVGPCHHMFEVNRDERQQDMWRALAQGAAPDWPALFAGYASCVDWPSTAYWRELAAFCPDARVVLTWRSAESWWASFERTILPVIRSSQDEQSLGVALIARQVFGGRPDDRAHAIATYEAHVEEVKATIAPDRLLIYPVGAGWDPLCRHLGLPVPDEPFPQRNSSAEFQAAVEQAEPR